MDDDDIRCIRKFGVIYGGMTLLTFTSMLSAHLFLGAGHNSNQVPGDYQYAQPYGNCSSAYRPNTPKWLKIVNNDDFSHPLDNIQITSYEVCFQADGSEILSYTDVSGTETSVYFGSNLSLSFILCHHKNCDPN